MKEKSLTALGQPELSVVILFYRAESLAYEIFSQISNELSDEKIDYELILVGNYHSQEEDKTPEILKKLAKNNPRAHVIAKVKKGMMGWDMRSGLKACTGKYLAIIDGDGQMILSDVIRIYRIIQLGEYDLVKTFRVKRYDGLYRTFISNVYNLVFRFLFRPQFLFHDINAKPKIMTREAYERMDLISNDWFADAEIMIEAIKNNYRVNEISTIFYKNEQRGSFIAIKDIFEFMKNMIIYRFHNLRANSNAVDDQGSS